MIRKLISKIIGTIRSDDGNWETVDDTWLSNVAYVNNIGDSVDYLNSVYCGV